LTLYNQLRKSVSERILETPPQLLTSPWPEYELAVLKTLSKDLRKAIKKVEERPTTNRVHTARVVLRRWQSIGRILDQDTLTIESYTLVKNELNKLRKRLGKIRDWEILIDLATNFELPSSLSRGWGRHCVREQKKLRAKLDGKFLRKSLKKLEETIEQEDDHRGLFGQLSLKSGKTAFQRRTNGQAKIKSKTQLSSAYDHLEPYLRYLEDHAKELEMKAFSPTQLHELRIAVKSWRYFLTEFYGLTNLQLVKAQQLLGKVHDIDRLIEILKDNNQLSAVPAEKLKRLNEFRGQLLDEFGKLRKHMPYGLRPSIGARAGVPDL
jgi:CHAD domain-containing protein